MGRYFGTDGFRGKANEGLTAEHAFEIGRFLGWYYGRRERARIVVGKDTRRSSYMLEYAISAGVAASGADVYLLHVTTTPSVSYVTRTDGFDCGVMISASHNPFYDNGIKLMNREGEKMDEATIALVEDYLDEITSGNRREYWQRCGSQCRTQSLYGLSDVLGHVFVQGKESGTGLCQRQRVADCSQYF